MDGSALEDYHHHIRTVYDSRSANHEKSTWHRTLALKLVEEMPPSAGDVVLDIGTGTGTIAFRAAEKIGADGRSLGVDISQGMLSEAERKLAASGLANLEFVLGDAEQLPFSHNSFNRIYCASAFFCMLDPLATLRHWRDLLKSGGTLAFHGIPASAHFYVSVARDVLAEHGFPFLLNMATATVDRTRTLLMDAGFRQITIREDKTGFYMPLDKALDTWMDINSFAPGQYPHPMRAVSPDIDTQCKSEYQRRIKILSTEKGVWNDITMYYVYAHK